MIDLFLHAGTKFALEQWLDARGLGDSFQDTDATSPTFGDWFYRHTDDSSTFIWWRHPSGKLEVTAPVIDGEGNVTTPGTTFTGFYGILRFQTFEDMDSRERFEMVEDTDEDSPTFGEMVPVSKGTVGDWVRNNTAVSVLESFAGYGGEGITIIAPEDVQAYLEAQGLPGHEFLGGMGWSDPRVWFLGPVMIGDVREFDGVEYESLIDFNVFTPTQAPLTWQEVTGGGEDPGGDIESWKQPGTVIPGSSPPAVYPAYMTDQRVIWPYPEEGGVDYVWRSKIDNNTAEPSRDSGFFRYWEPESPA
jgi:hypothetical protein